MSGGTCISVYPPVCGNAVTRYFVARIAMIAGAVWGLGEYMDHLHVPWEQQFAAILILGCMWMMYPDPKVTAGGKK